MMFRASVSLFATSLLTYSPLASTLRKPINIVRDSLFGGYKSASSLQRGAESQIMSGIIHSAMAGFALAGAFSDDDDDKVYQNAYRYFLPMWINIIADTLLEEDPVKFLRIYTHRGYQGLHSLWDFASDNF